MAKKLTAIGIDSPEKLTGTGSKQAFLKLKQAYPQVCLVHLYALEGAIQNMEFNCLSEAIWRLGPLCDGLLSTSGACSAAAGTEFSYSQHSKYADLSVLLPQDRDCP